MNLPFPEQAAKSVLPPKGMSPGRFTNRDRLFRRLVAESPQREFASDFHQASIVRSMDNAYRLLSSDDRKAFDITQEPRESYEKYDTGRLVEVVCWRAGWGVGCEVVEVTTEYVPFLHWDTHQDGHRTVARMHSEMDRPISQLILDLEARGLLDRTLVVIASEFSRDAIMEGRPGSSANDQATHKVDKLGDMKHYGLHRHFTGGTSVVMFGGGTKRGFCMERRQIRDLAGD